MLWLWFPCWLFWIPALAQSSTPSYSKGTNNNDNRRLLGEEALTLEFSLWSSEMQTLQEKDNFFLEQDIEPILFMVNEFLCLDTAVAIVQVDEGLGLDVCGKPSTLAVLYFNETYTITYHTSPMTTTLEDDDEDSNSTTHNNLAWTTWSVEYNVVEKAADDGTSTTVSDSILNSGLQNYVQSELDGWLDGENSDTLDENNNWGMLRFAPVGKEVETFSVSYYELRGEQPPPIEEDEEESFYYLDPDYFSKAAKIIRILGVVMCLCTVAAAIVLGHVAKQVRLAKEIEDEQVGYFEDNDLPICHTALITEAGVDEMLEIGRMESLKALAGTSQYICPSTEFASLPDNENEENNNQDYPHHHHNKKHVVYVGRPKKAPPQSPRRP